MGNCCPSRMDAECWVFTMEGKAQNTIWTVRQCHRNAAWENVLKLACIVADSKLNPDNIWYQSHAPLYAYWTCDGDVARALELRLIWNLYEQFPSLLDFWAERAWHSLTILACFGTDFFIRLLCKMEFCVTIDKKAYWELSSTLQQTLNFDVHPERQKILYLQEAFLDPNHQSYDLARRTDAYRRLITDLLTVAGAQLTLLYKDYAKYTRVAITRRLQERFIGFDPVDQMRVDALQQDSANSADAMLRASGWQKPKSETTQKEKQRKKASEKKKARCRKMASKPPQHDSHDLPEDARAPTGSRKASINSVPSLGQGNFTQSWELDAVDYGSMHKCPRIPCSLHFTLQTLETKVEACKVFADNGSCDHSIRTPAPRSSVASIWTAKNQSSSTSNTSPGSDENDTAHSNDGEFHLVTLTKDIDPYNNEFAHLWQLTKRNKQIASSVREEEMHAHIVRIARQKRGAKAALFMTALLPKPRESPDQAIIRGSVQVDMAAPVSKAATEVLKTTKQKRRSRAKVRDTNSCSKDLDIAGDLLYATCAKPDCLEAIESQHVSSDVRVTQSCQEVKCEIETISTSPARGRNFNDPRWIRTKSHDSIRVPLSWVAE